MIFFACGLCFLACRERGGTIQYPSTPTVNVVEERFGVKVHDPYRWLEELDETTVNWALNQHALTEEYLKRIAARDTLYSEFLGLFSVEWRSTPVLRGKKLFYLRGGGVHPQPVLVVRDWSSGEERVVVDPVALYGDSAVAIASFHPSAEGRWVACQFTLRGSDWRQIRVFDVERGEPLDEVLMRVKFSPVLWVGEGGFYYSRFDTVEGDNPISATVRVNSIYFHRVGTPPHTDRLVFTDTTPPLRMHGFWLSEDTRWMALLPFEGIGREALWLRDAGCSVCGWYPVDTSFNHEWDLIGHDLTGVFMVSDWGSSPQRKVLRFDWQSKQLEEVFVPQSNKPLQNARVCGGRLVVVYLEDVEAVMEVRTTRGELLFRIPLPAHTSVGDVSCAVANPYVFFSVSGYDRPPEVYQLNLDTRELTLLYRTQIPVDLPSLKVEKHFYVSTDGTRVPLWLIYDSTRVRFPAPAYLYGYGGFRISILPQFRSDIIPFVRRGGLVAVANLRGGYEYGEEWHRQGCRHNKKQVFEDFVAAGRYLIERGYTRRRQIAIHGRSNGGLLVASALLMAPELWGCAVVEVGVLDMLRFHLFSIGWAWMSEYGNPDDSADFHYLLSYSPYHNVRPARYPPVLVITALYDDRVVPAHSFKFVAQLQAHLPVGAGPALLYVDTLSGHGYGKSVEARARLSADRWAFILHSLR